MAELSQMTHLTYFLLQEIINMPCVWVKRVLLAWLFLLVAQEHTCTRQNTSTPVCVYNHCKIAEIFQMHFYTRLSQTQKWRISEFFFPE